MFVQSGFLIEQLSDIMSTGKVNVVEPIFLEFNCFLQSLGLDVVVSAYEVRAQLIAGQPSRMSIYLRTPDNMVQNEVDPRLHNWERMHKYTHDIVVRWKALIRKHGFPQSHVADKVYVDFYSFEAIYLAFLPRTCKADFVQAVNNLLKDKAPSYVFCSSEPAYNVIFAAQTVLSDHQNLGNLDKVCTICDDVLSHRDLFGYYRSGAVKVHFYHREDKNLNLYGLSRED